MFSHKLEFLFTLNTLPQPQTTIHINLLKSEILHIALFTKNKKNCQLETGCAGEQAQKTAVMKLVGQGIDEIKNRAS